MTGLMPLLKKEMMEQWRTYKLLIVACIFLFFGLTTPLLLKYLPEILKLAGTSGLDIKIPPPTAVQSLAEFTSTVGQIGVFVAVLMAMGSIANEIKQGTAVITLSKPVSRAAFVNAKLIALSATFLVSLAVSSLLCYAYTVWLIGEADIMAFAGQSLLLGLFLVFCLAITLMFSSLFKSSLASGGIAIAIVVGQGVLSAIPRVGDFFPGKMLSWGNQLLAGGGNSYWLALAITVAITAGSIVMAQRWLRHKDF